MRTMQRGSAPQAIQTRYKGYHFRSRLEARWAVFFDACSIDWEYEAEGYDLSDFGASIGNPRVGYYLPDFWLPKYKSWVEIKGVLPDDHFEETDEELRMFFLVTATKSTAGYVFWGLPELGTKTSSVFWNNFPSRYPISSRGTDSVCLFSEVCDEALNAAKSARFEHGQRGRT